MRVGVASGRHAAQIHEALSQRIGIEADIVPPDADAKQYDLILAVDDEIVPAGTETRRYITHHKTQAPEWNVVAGRHLLIAAMDKGITNPIAVPLPFTSPASVKPPQEGVALLQDQPREVEQGRRKAQISTEHSRKGRRPRRGPHVQMLLTCSRLLGVRTTSSIGLYRFS